MVVGYFFCYLSCALRLSVITTSCSKWFDLEFLHLNRDYFNLIILWCWYFLVCAWQWYEPSLKLRVVLPPSVLLTFYLTISSGLQLRPCTINVLKINRHKHSEKWLSDYYLKRQCDEVIEQLEILIENWHFRFYLSEECNYTVFYIHNSYKLAVESP